MRGKRKRETWVKKKVSGREEKVRADLRFQLSPGSYANREGGREGGGLGGGTRQLRQRDGWMDVDVEEGRERGARQSHSV